MKRVICLVALLGFLINAEAQYIGKKGLADFNEIEISGVSNVNLFPSDTNYILVHSIDSLVDGLHAHIKAGVLYITSGFKGDLYAKKVVAIRTTDVSTLACKDTLKGGTLKLIASDASCMNILVNSNTVAARSKDASQINLAGFTNLLEAKSSDASHINGYKLKSLGVTAVASDGSSQELYAENSIEANATDGSNINVKGSPKQKNTSASDAGSVTMSDIGEQAIPDNGKHSMDKLLDDDSIFGKNNEKHVEVNDGFIGGGFVTGGSQAGAPVKYGASREFIVGGGWEYKIFKWDGIGVDVYYKSTDFYLNEDSAKTFPNKTLHDQEKISFQNFGGLVYDRLHFGKNIFLDGGIYGDWAFHSKYITWDDNTSDASSTKIIQRNLSFVNPLDYGLTFRFGSTEGLSIYFNYRLSNLFQNTPASSPAYPELPAYTIGINIGGF